MATPRRWRVMVAVVDGASVLLVEVALDEPAIGPPPRPATGALARPRGDRRASGGRAAGADRATRGAPGESSSAADDAPVTAARSPARPRRGRGAARDDEGLALTATPAPIPRRGIAGTGALLGTRAGGVDRCPPWPRAVSYAESSCTTSNSEEKEKP